MREKISFPNFNPENPFHSKEEISLAVEYANATDRLQTLLKRTHPLDEEDENELNKILNQKIFETEEGEIINSKIIFNLSKSEIAKLEKEESETMNSIESIKKLIYNDYREIIYIIKGLNEKIESLDENNRLYEKFLEKKGEKEKELKEIINEIHKLIDKIGFEKEEIENILNQMKEKQI